MRYIKLILLINLMELIIGIDFGTSNTIITYFENNKANILMDGVYKNIPTKIGINNENIYCGNYIPINAKIINNFKTLIGTENFNLIPFQNKLFGENELLIIFFTHLKNLILNKFPNITNLKTIITTPSNFNDKQREIIKNNFILSGFNILRIINEPSAAALSYGLNKYNINEEKILVLDLGAGTFDITILLKDNGFFEVESSIGLNDLGGNDFTNLIYNYVLKNNPNINWYACNKCKEKLSYLDEYEIKNYGIITKNQFEKLSNNLINKIEELLIDIKNKNNDIQYIILVGNSSKIPFIQKLVLNIFNIKPLIHPNLDTIVSEGACLYGAIIENVYQSEEKILLIDVLPLSLGVETIDGNFSIIIPKNTPLPIKRNHKYTIDTPGENSVMIKIYQGERKIANKNILIGEFLFDKVSIDTKPIIDICIKVDLNGIINIIITDKKTGIDKNILIKNINKLNDEEIENIINLANINNLLDENEMIRNNRLYQLNTKIENIMNNININELIIPIMKEKLLNNLIEFENKIENSNNTELLNIIKEIDDNFSNFLQDITINNDDKDDDFDKYILIELKEDLFNRINLLINKNPQWTEDLEPILEELKINNLSIDYLQNKLEIIKELEDNDDINYKEQFKNLCLFIKKEIEENNIELNNDKLNELNTLINNNLLLLEKDDDIDWNYELNNFNEYCFNII
jgi:molecular chaperone DnaK